MILGMDLPIWAETWLVKATETAAKKSAFGTMSFLC